MDNVLAGWKAGGLMTDDYMAFLEYYLLGVEARGRILCLPSTFAEPPLISSILFVMLGQTANQKLGRQFRTYFNKPFPVLKNRVLYQKRKHE